MKKLVIFLVMMSSLAFFGRTLSAQNNETVQSKNQTIRTGFLDNNGDGVCDNYDGTRAGQGLGPGHGNGQGRINGKGLGRFNRQGRGRTETFSNQNGKGITNYQRGLGRGNYVDNNNNGLCDRLENGSGPQLLRDGSGQGNGQVKK